MSAIELLKERGIASALIIDDGYDEVPTSADLSTNDDGWRNFFDDFSIHEEVVAEAFPDYEKVDAGDLIMRDDFVAALWDHRDKLDAGTQEALFGDFSRDKGNDLIFLTGLEDKLKGCGIRPIAVGRDADIPDQETVPLIFVDLFLDGAQNDASEERSIERVLGIIEGRRDDPPLIVLMSRSTRLEQRKEEFRRKSKLLGAMFRVATKSSLEDIDVLTRVLSRLAQHRPDAKKIAKLLHVWDEGLIGARTRFMESVRKLDLTDYAQIRDLLLNFEGQPLGSYLIDVFDRVLQHEIERDTDLIAAAADVNTVDLERYLAPNISGSPDLQELVYRTIYHNPERLNVTGDIGDLPISFGDLLIDKRVFDDPSNLTLPFDVMAVLTAACDLVRDGVDYILLLQGKLKPLGPTAWSYDDKAIRTPIISFADGRRFWISWTIKAVTGWSREDVKVHLADDGGFVKHARLRESVALELQQKMLSNLGRVGQIAPMPACFPVAIQLYRPNANGDWIQLASELLTRRGGVIFVGRDDDSNPNSRLVISEDVCEEIAMLINSLTDEDVPEAGRPSLAKIKAGQGFLTNLEQGLNVSGLKENLLEIRAMVDVGGGPKEEIVAFATRGSNPTKIHKQACKRAVIALIISEPENGPVPMGAS
ncbi:hypothetical protein [Roseovarius sp. M141]|uniref:hypothetical protein n=1 Tax=Roseovarius sp. M141 TaxID=2583806 RepID=UPI0020CF08AD|nr:hypothetical protein [Roseovarius sp. M141]MCQ0093395.1 hypothetical protein [Roseovarius sp. M141]